MSFYEYLKAITLRKPAKAGFLELKLADNEGYTPCFIYPSSFKLLINNEIK